MRWLCEENKTLRSEFDERSRDNWLRDNLRCDVFSFDSWSFFYALSLRFFLFFLFLFLRFLIFALILLIFVSDPFLSVFLGPASSSRGVVSLLLGWLSHIMLITKKSRESLKRKADTDNAYHQRVAKWEASLSHDINIKSQSNSMTQIYYSKRLLSVYMNEIHECRLIHDWSCIFQEDNDSSHDTRSTVNIVRTCKAVNWIETLYHSSQSSDLNSSERVWNNWNSELTDDVATQWKSWNGSSWKNGRKSRWMKFELVLRRCLSDVER